MAHPYKEAGHKNDPKWAKELEQYKEADLKATVRNHATPKMITAQAAYEPKPKKD